MWTLTAATVIGTAAGATGRLSRPGAPAAAGQSLRRIPTATAKGFNVERANAIERLRVDQRLGEDPPVGMPQARS